MSRLLSLTLAAALLAAAAPARAVPPLPPGYGNGFPVLEDIEWTGPSLEPVQEHGLRFKVVRMDGKTASGTVGSLREKLVRAVKEAGWPVPSEPRVDSLERYEDVYFRPVANKLQFVEVLIFRQKDVNYIVVKAYADRKLTGTFDPAKVPYWHLPRGYGEGFPIFPFAELGAVGLKTIGSDIEGVTPFPVGYAEAVVHGYTLTQVRNWYEGRLKEDVWPIPAMYNRDDDDHFDHAFARRLNKVRMSAHLVLKQPKPEEPVTLTIQAHENTASGVDDAMAQMMEEKEEARKSELDFEKLIVDIDPADPEIDFSELPNGWGNGFPVHPETQYIRAKIRHNEVIGQKWREAVISGAFLSLTVRQVRDWYLKACAEAGYEVPTIHEEDEENLFQTRLKRVAGDYHQSIKLRIFERVEDGLTQADIIAQEDTETGKTDPNNPDVLMTDQ